MTSLFQKLIRLAIFAIVMSCAMPRSQAALTLHAEQGSKYDLAIKGELRDVPVGQTRYLPWQDLRKLPTQTLSLAGEFVPGEQKVTVVFLSDLLKALPLSKGADTVLATCTDGYASVYKADFITKYRPFIILEINGDGPEKWPPAGLTFNPGPYVISFSPQLVPGAPPFLDAEHKKPWGVASIEIANFAERFRDIYRGSWSRLSTRAEAGRDIWVNSCASCHAGPAGVFGGTKSPMPFDLLATLAGRDPGFFKRYVRDPQGTVPGAKMEAHPHYTDVQMGALMAFITAEGIDPSIDRSIR